MKAKSKKTDKKSGSAGNSASAGIRTAAAAGAAAIRSSDCSSSRPTLPAASDDPNSILTAAGSRAASDPKESEKNNCTCSKWQTKTRENSSYVIKNYDVGDGIRCEDLSACDVSCDVNAKNVTERDKCSKSNVVGGEDLSLKNENPERGDDMMSLKCKKSGSKSSTDTWIVCESKNIPSPSDGVGTVSSDSKAMMQPPLKKMKIEKDSMPDRRSVSVITDPECLGPCDPGSSVILEGIVWNESRNGLLVVNVTWRGKTYVGTLMDSSNHLWASPSFREDSASTGSSFPEREGESNIIEGRRLRRGRNGQSSSLPPTVASKSNGTASTKSRLQSASVGAAATSRTDLPKSSLSKELIACPEVHCQKRFRHASALRNHRCPALKLLSTSGMQSEKRNVFESSNDGKKKLAGSGKRGLETMNDLASLSEEVNPRNEDSAVCVPPKKQKTNHEEAAFNGKCRKEKDSFASVANETDLVPNLTLCLDNYDLANKSDECIIPENTTDVSNFVYKCQEDQAGNGSRDRTPTIFAATLKKTTECISENPKTKYNPRNFGKQENKVEFDSCVKFSVAAENRKSAALLSPQSAKQESSGLSFKLSVSDKHAQENIKLDKSDENCSAVLSISLSRIATSGNVVQLNEATNAKKRSNLCCRSNMKNQQKIAESAGRINSKPIILDPVETKMLSVSSEEQNKSINNMSQRLDCGQMPCTKVVDSGSSSNSFKSDDHGMIATKEEDRKISIDSKAHVHVHCKVNSTSLVSCHAGVTSLQESATKHGDENFLKPGDFQYSSLDEDKRNAETQKIKTLSQSTNAFGDYSHTKAVSNYTSSSQACIVSSAPSPVPATTFSPFSPTVQPTVMPVKLTDKSLLSSIFPLEANTASEVFQLPKDAAIPSDASSQIYPSSLTPVSKISDGRAYKLQGDSSKSGHNCHPMRTTQNHE